MIALVIILTIISIMLANYMFLRRDKRKMLEEERSNEKRERLMEILRSRAEKNETPEESNN